MESILFLNMEKCFFNELIMADKLNGQIILPTFLHVIMCINVILHKELKCTLKIKMYHEPSKVKLKHVDNNSYIVSYINNSKWLGRLFQTWTIIII